METGSLETGGTESSLKIVKRRKDKDFEKNYPFLSDLSLCPHVIYYFQVIPACKKKKKKIQEKMGAQTGAVKRGGLKKRKKSKKLVCISLS